MKKALITGITGQDGSYLAEFLLEKGYEVHGIIRRSSSFNTERIDHLMSNDEVWNKTLFLHHGDLSDSSNLNDLVNKIQPDEVYNLAAQSHVKVSFDVPEYTADVNANGTLRLLEAIHKHCPKAKYYQASTSEMFGGQEDEMPENGFTETTPFHPRSPYGVAKLYAYWIVRNYREAYGLHASNGLLFNHESPRRGDTFVTKKITNWCKKWKENNGDIEPLNLGNLNAYRDWGHAKDFVKAQWMILQQEEPNDYVIATGEMYTVRHFVDECFRQMGHEVVWKGEGLDEVGYCDDKPIVVINPKYFRPSEVDILLGDSTKARKELGWEPQYDFEALVKDMLND